MAVHRAAHVEFKTVGADEGQIHRGAGAVWGHLHRSDEGARLAPSLGRVSDPFTAQVLFIA